MRSRVSGAEDPGIRVDRSDQPEIRPGQTWDEIGGPGFVTVRSLTTPDRWCVYTAEGLAWLDESAIRARYRLRWYVVTSVDSDGTSWWLSASGTMVSGFEFRRFDTPESAKQAELPRGWAGVVARAPSPTPSDE